MNWKQGASALALLAVSSFAPAIDAADHRDGPQAKSDPTADVNDLFAWMSTDASKVYLAMTVFPAATTMSKFSNVVQYVFNTYSTAKYGMPSTSTVKILCSFDVAQQISCWVGTPGAAPVEYVTGDASATAGITSSSGKFKVFAGLRNDPFFFNLNGFLHAAQTVHGAAGALMFDLAGCPNLDVATAGLLVSQLTHDTDGTSPPLDNFSKLNGLAIVVSIDKTLLTAGGPVLGVYASLHKAQ